MRQSLEIEAVVRRFLESRMANDMDAMRNLHSDSEFLRLIGSDEHQWFRGRDAVRPTGGGSDAADWSPEFQVADAEVLRLEAFEEGNTGWAAVEQKRTLVNGQEFVFRITLVLRLEASVWKLVQIHFSHAVADDAILNVDLTTTLSDLLESVEPESGFGDEAAVLSTTTILFTDVVDSTVLSKAIGDEAWAARIASHFRTVRKAVESNGGSVVKTLGDGGMYRFGSATAALATAIDIQVELSASHNGFSLRSGIHSGDVVESESDILGLTVNKAARVAAAAQGGQILVSSTTLDMINTSQFTFADPVTADLKGIDGTHLLIPLLWDQTRT
jgi:class 3 adenylate cyclase